MDILTQNEEQNILTVKMLVKNNSDTCCVRVKIPFVVYRELKFGVEVWWHADRVFLPVFGVKDVAFPKVGFSGGNADSFYEEKNKISERTH